MLKNKKETKDINNGHLVDDIQQTDPQDKILLAKKIWEDNLDAIMAIACDRNIENELAELYLGITGQVLRPPFQNICRYFHMLFTKNE